MSKRTPQLLLEDMLDAIKNIRAYTQALSFTEFDADNKTKDAVIRNFEIIGEAANKLSPELLTRHPQVDWSGVIGFRNVLIHNYFGVDYSVVWAIIQNNLPALEREIELVWKNS